MRAMANHAWKPNSGRGLSQILTDKQVTALYIYQ